MYGNKKYAFLPKKSAVEQNFCISRSFLWSETSRRGKKRLWIPSLAHKQPPLSIPQIIISRAGGKRARGTFRTVLLSASANSPPHSHFYSLATRVLIILGALLKRSHTRGISNLLSNAISVCISISVCAPSSPTSFAKGNYCLVAIRGAERENRLKLQWGWLLSVRRRLKVRSTWMPI